MKFTMTWKDPDHTSEDAEEAARKYAKEKGCTVGQAYNELAKMFPGFASEYVFIEYDTETKTQKVTH